MMIESEARDTVNVHYGLMDQNGYGERYVWRNATGTLLKMFPLCLKFDVRCINYYPNDQIIEICVLTNFNGNFIAGNLRVVWLYSVFVDIHDLRHNTFA